MTSWQAKAPLATRWANRWVMGRDRRAKRPSTLIAHGRSECGCHGHGSRWFKREQVCQEKASSDVPAPARRRELCEGFAESIAETSPVCTRKAGELAVCAHGSADISQKTAQDLIGNLCATVLASARSEKSNQQSAMKPKKRMPG